MRVGIYHNPPMMLTENVDIPEGFVVDFINEVAKQENWQLEYVSATWPEQIANLESGKIDVLGGIGYSKERAKKYAYTDVPVVSSWGQIYSSKDKTDYLSLLDLANKKIGVLKNDIYFEGTQGLRSVMQRFGVNGKFVTFDSYADILDAVEDRSIDAGVVSRLSGEFLAKNKNIHKTPILFNPVEVHFATSKLADTRSHKILNTISQHLKIDKQLKSSAYVKSFNRWMNYGVNAETPNYFRYIAFGLLTLMGIALIKALHSNRKTQQKNMELSAEHTFIKQQEHLLSAMDDMSDVLMILDRRGNIIHTSNHDKNFGSYRKQEIIGREFHQFFDIGGRIQIKQALAKLMSEPTGTQSTLEVSTGLPDNADSTNRVALRMVNHLENPEIKGIFVVIQDINHIKNIHSTVDKNHLIRNTAFTTAHDAVVICNENSEILDFNRTALKLLRLDQGTALFSDLMSNPKQWERLFKKRENVQKPPFTNHFITLITPEIKTKLVFDAYAIELNHKNEQAVLISLRDITTQQLLKAQLEELEKNYNIQH